MFDDGRMSQNVLYNAREHSSVAQNRTGYDILRISFEEDNVPQEDKLSYDVMRCKEIFG